MARSVPSNVPAIPLCSRISTAAKKASSQKVQDRVDFLVQDKGMAPYDAYSLLSLAGDVRMLRTLREISPVKMLLSRQILEQLG